jgi:hypothetical protein
MATMIPFQLGRVRIHVAHSVGVDGVVTGVDSHGTRMDEDVAPRSAAIFLHAGPPFVFIVAAAVSTAALSPAPPLLMKHGQAAAVRMSCLVPYVVVQTGMVVAHAAAFTMGAVCARVEVSRMPKHGRGGHRHVDPERVHEAGAGAGEGAGAGALKPDTSADVRRGTVVSVGGSTSEPKMPTKRPGGNVAGHPFDIQNSVRVGRAAASTRCGFGFQSTALDSIPGTPPRPGSLPTVREASTARASGAEGGSASGGERGTVAKGTTIAGGSSERAKENAWRRRMTFAVELTVSAVMFRLSFAVAAVDGWREFAVACDAIALCVLFVACHNWDDEWRRVYPTRWPSGRDGCGEALLSGVSSGTYGGLDRNAVGFMRGGVYDHVRRKETVGMIDADGIQNARRNDGFHRVLDPRTLEAIRQYKRYRAKDFDLENVSVRSADSDAYSLGVSAFGGLNGRNGALGSDFGGDSEAGYAESVRSELRGVCRCSAGFIDRRATANERRRSGLRREPRAPRTQTHFAMLIHDWYIIAQRRHRLYRTETDSVSVNLYSMLQVIVYTRFFLFELRILS